MRGCFGRPLEPVITALIAKILEYRAVIFPFCCPQLDPVQIHIAADHGRCNGNGLLLQAQQSLQLFAGTCGVFGRDHADHLEHVCFQTDRAHFRHHRCRDRLIPGQCTELVHLIFQKERILAAALQQRRRCAVRQGGFLLLCAIDHHHFQFKGLGLSQFFGVAKRLALRDQLLCALACFELAALQFKHAAQHHHSIFQTGKGAVQLFQILVTVSCRVDLRQHHHTPGTKK